MRSLILMALTFAALTANSATAQTIKLTPQAEEWKKKSAKEPIKFVVPGQKDPYTFTGDYGHEGVNLTAQQVNSIQADHVFE